MQNKMNAVKSLLLIVTLLLSLVSNAWACYDIVRLTKTEAFTNCKKLAGQGDVQAQFFLGLIYHSGDGVTQDYQAAVEWYRKAAEQGHADAQEYLGGMYQSGEGVTQDYQAAVKWYRKAAEQEHAEAQSNLGVMYANGEGVTQDHKEAMKWFKKSADQGNARGQHNLERMSKGIAKQGGRNYSALRQEIGWSNDFSSRCEVGRPVVNMKKLIENDNWDETTTVGLTWLKSCPVDALIHAYTSYSLNQLGRESEADIHRVWAHGLITSIRASGDGKSAKTAFVTISVNEEYDLLYFSGLTLKEQSLLDGDIDMLVVENEAGEESKVYFNPTAHFARLKKL